ncbi:histidine--tRNA ligase [Blastopirellula marina]|uniref:Histidine--tRNA ligase n=1 Tax=Blastopirellula marina TaxID=124 RepID=A0A2S8GP69_9BACT|nr:histidine--tRNA ligase [Blastopirellula marina]PQO46151.1 histidine--tRNA ligase [Blastopirellula marina]
MSNKKNRIQPRTLKGFRDYLPDAMMPREELVNTARRVYRSYGFAPIDTPTLEYSEILLGKGSDETDRQMYRFRDHGDRDVGMRFDLTVPLARFAAQHIGTLGTPFKRYHIATVWRGENTQRGRYREFMQCDFDTIGTKSLVADIETALVIHDLMLAIGFDAFTVRVNNRQVLSGLLEKLELAEKSTEVLRALDKLGKIGPEKVSAEMQEVAGATAEQAAQVLKLAEIGGTSDEILSSLDKLIAGSEKGETGVGQLRELTQAAAAAGVPDERLQIDVSIARGLDYYTGTIFETFLGALPQIGSVCSGGRYNDLASLYTNQELPGIGASLGLDRLLAAMEDLGMIEQRTTPAEVFLPYFDEASLQAYIKIAAQLRGAGFNVELYPEAKKLGQQLKYADRRGFKVAVVAGDRELAENSCQLKDLKTGDTQTVSLADGAAELIAAIPKILRSTT